MTLAGRVVQNYVMPFDPPGDSLIAPGQARLSAPPFHVRYNPVSSALWCAADAGRGHS